jgi:hypothetical protein
MVGAGRRVVLGAGVSEEVSYDVYVKNGVDLLGRDEFGEAVAHFMEQSNAVALKRRLEARGETVRVERTSVHGLSGAAKDAWFSDYSRVPEFELSGDQGSPERAHEAPETVAGDQQRESHQAQGGAQESSERSWWRRVFGE